MDKMHHFYFCVFQERKQVYALAHIFHHNPFNIKPALGFIFFNVYTLIFPAVPFLGVDLADYREIGAMKLDAVQSRGKKRDFVDLWAIFQKGIILGDLLSYFQKKYAGVAYNTQHLLKSLTYFADAEEDEMPQMLVKVSWEEIKDFMENSVKDFVSAGLKW